MVGTCSVTLGLLREAGVDVTSVAELCGGLGDEVGRDVGDGVRAGRVGWVRALVGIHSYVKGEHVGGPFWLRSSRCHERW